MLLLLVRSSRRALNISSQFCGLVQCREECRSGGGGSVFGRDIFLAVPQ